MPEIIIYEKSTCSKCRVANEILDANGVAYRKIFYHDAPLTKAELVKIIEKLNITPKELLRVDDVEYRTLGLDHETLNDDDAIEIMIKYPDLMQRPILVCGERAIIGRPPERINEFLRTLQ